MNLEDTVLRKKTEKGKYCILITYTWNIKTITS